MGYNMVRKNSFLAELIFNWNFFILHTFMIGGDTPDTGRIFRIF